MDAPHSRFLTYLFCDLVDSTALTRESDDPEAIFEWMNRFQREAAQCIEAHDGYVARYMGDAVLAYFGYPVALESNAESAVRCALALQEGVKALHPEWQVRIGIANGRGILAELKKSDGSVEMSVVSEATNFAARLQSVAAADEILVSDQVRQQVGELFDFSAPRVVGLKGYDTPQTVHVVRGLGRFASHSQRLGEADSETGEMPCVGRAAELDALLAARAAAHAAGGGHSVLVRGEAGIGKTSLLREIRRRLDAPTLKLKLFGSQFETTTAFYPLRMAFEPMWPAGDDSALKSWLADAFGDAPWDAHYETLGRLLGHLPPLPLLPNVYSEHQFQALTAFVVELAHARPLALFAEDLHWFDATTLEWLGRLERVRPQSRVWVVAATRPVDASERGLAWDQRVELQRFAGDDIETLLADIDPEHRLIPAIRRLIAEKSGGVPLLVREFARAALTALAAGQPGGLVIPDNLLQSYLARIDTLGGSREIIDTAAIVGHGFDARLIARALHLPESAVTDTLHRLARHELVVGYATARGQAYNFSHALLGDAAYSTLLRRQRQALHQRVFDAWSELDPDFERSQPAQAARHLEATDQHPRAFAICLDAARARVAAAQFLEADGILDLAIGLVPHLDDPDSQRLGAMHAHALKGHAISLVRGYTDPGVRDAYGTAIALCNQLQLADAREFDLLVGVNGYLFVTGDIDNHDQHLARLFAIVERTADPTHALKTHSIAATNKFTVGDFAAAREHIRAAQSLYRVDAHAQLCFETSIDPYAQMHAFDAHVLAAQGDRDGSRAAADAAMAHAASLGFEFVLPYINVYARGALGYFGADDALLDGFEADRQLATRLGMVFWVMGAHCWRGVALCQAGRYREALADLEPGLMMVRASGMEYTASFMQCQRGAALSGLGQHRDALAQFEEGIALGNRRYDASTHAESLRLHGCALLAAGEAERARAAFGQGLALARQQGALGWECKLVTSLVEHELGAWLPDAEREDFVRRLLAAPAGTQTWTQRLRTVLGAV